MRAVGTALLAGLLLSAVGGAVPANGSGTADGTADDVVIADAAVRITDVIHDRTPDEPVATVPLGRRVIVAGVTNLQPDENLILVELRREGEVVAVEGTSTWGRSGEWVVDFDPGNLTAGEYVLHAEAAGASDAVELRVVAATPTETSTATPRPTPTGTPRPTVPPTASSTPTPVPTAGSGPGLGAVAALVALATALALRARGE